MEFTEKLLSEIRFDSTVVVLDILIPCILSLIFGGIIGFQREKTDRLAGLRTHALVCLGSTVFSTKIIKELSKFKEIEEITIN